MSDIMVFTCYYDNICMVIVNAPASPAPRAFPTLTPKAVPREPIKVSVIHMILCVPKCRVFRHV